jgi:UDP-glucose 4-epimerase
MRVLVTGGAGFIGSHVVEAYLAAGHTVAVFDNFSSGSLAHLEGLDLLVVPEDITDTRAMNDAVRAFRPEVINHHAAQLSVSVSDRQPLLDAKTNVLGTLNVLEAARTHGVKRVVFASSGGTVYGEASQTPTPEDAPLAPLSPYGISKMTGEHYLRFYQRRYGMVGVTLRYGNVYGPRQNPHGEAGVVAIFMDALQQGRSPVIHGDGEQRKDFVYVQDVVTANLLALEAECSSAYNVGGGEATSINELFRAVCDLRALSAKPVREAPRSGDVRVSHLDLTRIGRDWGWYPQWDLKRGVQATWSVRVATARGATSFSVS